MNAVHFHLLFNHVAILGVIFSTLLFLVSYFKRNMIMIRTAQAGFILSALVAIPVFLTGESAEHAIRDYPAVVNSDIHEHEEVAEITIWFIYALGLLAISGFFLDRTKLIFKKWFMLLLLLLSLASSAAIGFTGFLGGYIRHPEIRVSQNNLPQPSPNDGTEEGE